MNSGRRKILQRLSDKEITVGEALNLLGQSAEVEQATQGPVASSSVQPIPQSGNMVVASGTDGRLFECTAAYLAKVFASKLNLDVNRININSTFEPYGVDSVAVIELIDELEKDFGTLPKILLFEHNSIAKLTHYFLLHHRQTLEGLFQTNEEIVMDNLEALFGPDETKPRSPGSNVVPAVVTQRQDSCESRPSNQDIAIIGISGRYPMARDLNEFWRNLSSGKSCITEIPANRWDHTPYFHPDAEGKSYSKWGGFIEDVDKWDPLFFDISPKEAEQMDPQERLFLEIAWEALEDAGYTREELNRTCRKSTGKNVGVFVGVMCGAYQLFAPRAWARSNEPGPTSAYWSTANRVSYLFDFQGPSMAVDTACSASLTAIHLACESIKRGECSAAIAGGVTLIIHPSQFVLLTNLKMLSRDDRCRAFGQGANGFVDGEGVGAVLLRPLAAALQDGDQIYGVIKSTFINAGGKTSGYSVPNPQAQAELIATSLERANIDPRTLSYVEAHGTGTMLGDPIEIRGLTKAFQQYTDAKQYCAIGSVKSNIGHSQAAAGIAGLTKVLLQMKHKQIVPSLNTERLNPLIDFGSSPFYVAQAGARWERPVIEGKGGDGVCPRRAGISSFGIGGANAHLIVEEFAPRRPQTNSNKSRGDIEEVILLSARTAEQLREYARKLKNWIVATGQEVRPALGDIAYTLQLGREAMEARLAIIVKNEEELLERLDHFINHESDPEILLSIGLDPNHQVLSLLKAVLTESDLVQQLFMKKRLRKLAAIWVAGFDLKWAELHDGENHRRVSLPTYPFARKRCWIETSTPGTAPAAGDAPRQDPAKPLTAETCGTIDLSPGFIPVLESKTADRGELFPGKKLPNSLVGKDSNHRRPRLKEIEEWITASLVDSLKIDPLDLELDRPFNDYGMNSLVGVAIALSLGQWLGREIKATLLWEYPTIRCLAEHLNELEGTAAVGARDIPNEERPNERMGEGPIAAPPNIPQDPGLAEAQLLCHTSKQDGQTSAQDELQRKSSLLPLSIDGVEQLSEEQVDTYLAALLASRELASKEKAASPESATEPLLEKQAVSESEDEQLLKKLGQLSDKEALAYFSNLFSQVK